MEDLELAQLLADAADEISLARFRSQDLRIEKKPDRTPVTDADQRVEERIRELIAEHRPGDSVIG
ncbi:MAG: histidinol phosphatase, partial [Aquiluna sp.]